MPFLTTMGILPTKGPPSDPSWVGWLIGLIFGGAGILVVMKGFTGNTNDASGELPANSPRSLRAFYALVSVAIVCSLALLFTWIAFGPGPRHFSISTGGLSIPTSGAGDTLGRAAFGAGSVLFWCFAIGIVVVTARRWRR
jgi:hypothetical protein